MITLAPRLPAATWTPEEQSVGVVDEMPVAVTKSWQSHGASSDSYPAAEVVFSFDPPHPDDPSSLQFTMELLSAKNERLSNSYSLNMTKDLVLVCVFSETNQGKLAMERKIEHKFDMKPHEENIEEYGRLCCERKSKCVIRNRQIQVIDNDVGLFSTGAKDKKKIASLKQSNMKRTRRYRGELEYKKTVEDTSSQWII